MGVERRGGSFDVNKARRLLHKRSAPITRAMWSIGEVAHCRLPPLIYSNARHDSRETGPDDTQFESGNRTEGSISKWFDDLTNADLVLTAEDVTDCGVIDAVADPFLFVSGGEWHLFFEVYSRDKDPTAAIAHAVSPDAGRTWNYDQVILRSTHHLSYPYVFEWNGERYLLPDAWSKVSSEPAPVTLYRAEDFPTRWVEVSRIIEPETSLHDCTVFRWDGYWWALLGDGESLYAFYSDTLEREGWTPHDDNPVVRNRPRAARPGGRPFLNGDSVTVLFQDCLRRYGEKLRVYEITTLSPKAYVDEECDCSPVLTPSGNRLGWNSGAMHHLDIYQDGSKSIVVTDGDVGIGSPTFFDYRWVIASTAVSQHHLPDQFSSPFFGE